jgi:GT2 family glycosyltransferase
MLSILIVNWNTRSFLHACLTSIFGFPPRDPYEVVVVDNASKDGSAAMVREQFPDVKLIESPVNSGYAAGNNLAFEHAAGDFLLTLNPDTVLEDDSLQKSWEMLRKRPQYGCLAVRLVGVDGRTQRSVRGFPTFLGLLGDLTGLGARTPGSRLDAYRLAAFDYDREGPAPQPMGTFLMFRREALEAVGDPRRPFDERFPIFFNEVDLLYRLHRAGWPCLYTPEAHVVHHGGESTKLVRKSMIWESHRSLLRYMRKHSGSLPTSVGVALLAPIVYGAAFVRARGYHAGFRSDRHDM